MNGKQRRLGVLELLQLQLQEKQHPWCSSKLLSLPKYVPISSATDPNSDGIAHNYLHC